MFSLEFMRIAFMASGIVALITGPIGYFLLLRREAFAGHALLHVGFAGATGASLMGISPLIGLLIFSLMAGILIGIIGPELKNKDIAIGLVLSASMGLGLLFLHFYTQYAAQITSLLFGNIFVVDQKTLYSLAFLSIFCYGVMFFLARPLLFSSLQPDLAEAKGLSLKLISVIFLGLVACVTAACVQVTGILLTFSLMIGPAAVAIHSCKTTYKGILVSILFALLEAWGGIALAWFTDWPVSFWISFLSFSIYISSFLLIKTLVWFEMSSPQH